MDSDAASCADSSPRSASTRWPSSPVPDAHRASLAWHGDLGAWAAQPGAVGRPGISQLSSRVGRALVSRGGRASAIAARSRRDTSSVLASACWRTSKREVSTRALISAAPKWYRARHTNLGGSYMEGALLTGLLMGLIVPAPFKRCHAASRVGVAPWRGRPPETASAIAHPPERPVPPSRHHPTAVAPPG